jgi:hypothetical protein
VVSIAHGSWRYIPLNLLFGQSHNLGTATSVQFLERFTPNISQMAEFGDQSARYVIKTDKLGSPKALASTPESDLLVLTDLNPNETQLWYFEETGDDNYYRLHTEDKGDPYALSTFNTEGRQTFDLRFSSTEGQETTGQYWSVDKQDDGSFKLSNNKTGPGQYLDIDDSSSKPMIAARDSDKQQWTVSSLGSTPTSTQFSENSSSPTSTSVSKAASSSTSSACASNCPQSSKGSHGLGKGVIAGIVVGAIVALIIAVAILIWRREVKKRGRGRARRNSRPANNPYREAEMAHVPTPLSSPVETPIPSPGVRPLTPPRQMRGVAVVNVS